MTKITLLSVSLGIALAIFLPPRDAMAQFGVTIRTKDGAALSTDRIRVQTSIGTAQVLFVNSFVEIDNQNALRLRELTVNGTNFVALRASGLMGSDVTLTLPATAGAANQALSTDGAGILSWNSVVLGVTATPPLASSGGTNPNVSLTGVVGVANGGTGLAVTGAAGNYLRSDGTNWTSSAILAGDLPAGSGNYIQNQFAAAQAASFWISGAATFDGGVTHNGALTLNGTLTANGTAAFNGGVTIGSGASTAAVNTTTWDVSAAGTVTGATWNGATIATGFGGTNVSSSGAAGNYLRSDGTNWTSSAILAADLPTGSTNYIQNQSAGAQAASYWISGTGRVAGAMTLDTTLAVAGATTMSSTLAVSGATTLSSTLGVTGATTLSSTLSVAGASTMSSTLSVTGATTLASTLAVTGATTLSSNVTVGDGAGTDRLGFSGTSGIIQVGTFIPGAPLAGDLRYAGTSLLYYDGTVWQTLTTSGGGTAFSAITTGINSTAIMTVNTGAQIVPLGTGIIRATEFQGTGSLTTAVDLATAEVSGVLPVANGGTGANLSGTGGASQYVKQLALGGPFSVGAIAAADISGFAFIQNGNSFAALATLGTNDLQPLAFETFNTERMRLQTDGTVSIGTALDSVYRLDVQGGIINCGSSVYANIGAAAGPAFTFGTDSNTGMFGTGIDVIGYSTGGLERMRIDAAGNVGIGTAAPATTLDVGGAGTINAAVGYRVAGLATAGNFLRGNGTNFVASTILAADIPIGSGNYIQNQIALAQAAQYYITSADATRTCRADNSNGVGDAIWGVNTAVAGAGGGAGVYGLSAQSGGGSAGVYAQNSNAAGFGLFAFNSAASGASSGSGIVGQSTQSGGRGAEGDNFNVAGIGVIGFSAGAAGTSTGIGVYGTTNQDAGIGTYGPNTSAGTTLGDAEGVRGTTTATVSTFLAIGVRGVTNLANNINYPAFYGNGQIQATGTKSAIMKTSKGDNTLLFCQESPEVWFEDFGSAALKDGSAHVALDPVFIECCKIDAGHPMHVFPSPTDDIANPIYVTVDPDFKGFTVTESKGGKSNASFSYRLVAKRIDAADWRFPVTKPAAPPNTELHAATPTPLEAGQSRLGTPK